MMRKTIAVVKSMPIFAVVLLLSCAIGPMEKNFVGGKQIDYSNTSGAVAPDYQWTETVHILNGTISYEKLGGSLVTPVSFSRKLTDAELKNLSTLAGKIATNDTDTVRSETPMVGGGSAVLTLDNKATYHQDGSRQYPPAVANLATLIQSFTIDSASQ